MIFSQQVNVLTVSLFSKMCKYLGGGHGMGGNRSLDTLKHTTKY